MRIELSFEKMGGIFEAGCDEAGRGCLAGPVVAAAVILSEPILGIDDSKKLNEKTRLRLTEIIKSSCVAFGIGCVSPRRIDEINILNASIEAMHLALDALTICPEFILVDGNRFTSYKNIPYECIVKGDTKFQSIAAASILAKTERDQIMKELAAKHPVYHWANNKGYPTKDHVESIQKNGICEIHRKHFGIVKTIIQNGLVGTDKQQIVH